jgi:pimeloyl-ACP methyl ester carboxylesterase
MPPAKTRRATLLSALGLTVALAACSSSASGASTTPSPTATAPRAISAPDCFPAGAHALAEGSDTDFTAEAVAVVGKGTHGVLLAPQVDGDWCQWSFAFQHFLDKGYVVASFSWPLAPTDSIAEAVDALKRAGVKDYALVGASKGGSFVGAYAADVGAKSFVAFSPPATFTGANAEDGAQRFTGPLLVVASHDDNHGVPPTSSRRVSHADSDPSSFIEVPGTAHGLAILQGGGSQPLWDAMDATLAKGFA